MTADWVQVQNSRAAKPYFWDKTTNETSWDAPSETTPETMIVEHKPELLDKPVSTAWRKVKGPEKDYWWNVLTDETKWDLASEESEPRQIRTQRSASAFAVPSSSHASPAPTPPAAPPAADQHARPSRFGRIFRRSREDASDATEAVRRIMRDEGVDAQEAARRVTIGAPTDFRHAVHVRYDERNARFSGLPRGWIEHEKQFGVPLKQCPRVTVHGYRDRVPAVLVLLRQRMRELGGLSTEGIFRIAPDRNASEEARRRINESEGPVNALEDCTDPHVPANLIKQFLRELKPNLLNCLGAARLQRLADGPPDDGVLGAHVEDMSEPQRSVLLWLLDALNEVSLAQAQTRMTDKNLAIVLAPNLFSGVEDNEGASAAGDGASAAAADPMQELLMSQKVATLVERLLKWRRKDVAATPEDERPEHAPFDAEATLSKEPASPLSRTSDRSLDLDS